MAAHNIAFSFFVDLMSPAERKAYDAVVAAHPGLPDAATHEFLIAYDPVQQQERWRLPLGRAELAGGGVLTTAGNLVVQGTSAGKLMVYRADTGAVVREIDVGTGIMAAPVSYELDGEQYITVLAGFGGAMAPLYPAESAAYRHQNYGRLLTFKLGGAATPLPPARQPQQTPAPPQLPAATPATLQRGAGLFFTYCVFCHGAQGESRLSAYPDLFRLNAQVHGALRGHRARRHAEGQRHGELRRRDVGRRRGGDPGLPRAGPERHCTSRNRPAKYYRAGGFDGDGNPGAHSPSSMAPAPAWAALPRKHWRRKA